MNDPQMISSDFYSTLFSAAAEIISQASSNTALQDDARLVEQIKKVLKGRSRQKGLTLENAAVFLSALESNTFSRSRNLILESSQQLRKEIFGDSVAIMVPIEVSSFCASDCKFCGWRRSNKQVVRLKISEKALVEEVEALAKLGFSHFEIASGDDMRFIEYELEDTVKLLRATLDRVSPGARISICVTPLSEERYRILKACGLDAVLTWQETYDRDVYSDFVVAGPKASGLKWQQTNNKENGWLIRMQSQEIAIRAGLQVGLGVMLGLSGNLKADLLAVITHGQELIEKYYDTAQPLILGMPLRNATGGCNGGKEGEHPLDDDFELISAIYLLSFPDRHSWVFPNCRVSPRGQLRSVVSAGCFTSTMVRLSPGGYLNFSSDKNISDYFSRSSVPGSELDSNAVGNAEQFDHYFDSHQAYVQGFEASGLQIVSDTDLLSDFASHKEPPCG